MPLFKEGLESFNSVFVDGGFCLLTNYKIVNTFVIPSETGFGVFGGKILLEVSGKFGWSISVKVGHKVIDLFVHCHKFLQIYDD